MKLLEVQGGHVPQYPIAGDATALPLPTALHSWDMYRFLCLRNNQTHLLHFNLVLQLSVLLLLVLL